MNDISTVFIEAHMFVEFWKGESSKSKKDEKPQHGKDGGAKGVREMARTRRHKRRTV